MPDLSPSLLSSQAPSAADINCGTKPEAEGLRSATLTLTDAQSAVLATLAQNTGYADLRTFMVARLEGKLDYELAVLDQRDEVLQGNRELQDQFSGAVEKLALLLKANPQQIRIPLIQLFENSNLERASAIKLVSGLLVDAGFDPIYNRSGRFEVYERAGQLEAVFSGYQPDAKSSQRFTLLKAVREIEHGVFFPEGIEAPLLRQHANTCYRHSALYALAQHPVGQQIFKGMIEQVDESNFVVNFPGASLPRIEVSQSELRPQDDSEIRPYVSGSLGTQLISLAYSKLEALLNDRESFDYSAWNGGDAALVLRRFTGWNSVWFRNSGELLEFNPQSLKDCPDNMKEMIEFPPLSPLYERNPEELKKFEGLFSLMRNAANNPDRFILVAGSRAYIVPHDNPHNLAEAHAFAITKIEAHGEELMIEIVDPKDTAKAPVQLNQIEFIKCFRKISGVSAITSE